MDPATATALNALVVGDALGRIPMQTQAAVLGLTIATGAWAALRPRPAPIVAFVACSLLWSRANSALEGGILVRVTPDHGLTVADLLSPALGLLVLARAGWGRGRWPRER